MSLGGRLTTFRDRAAGVRPQDQRAVLAQVEAGPPRVAAPRPEGAVEPRGYRGQNKRGARGSDAAQLRYRIDRSAAFRRRS
jgi:hypothetical protein